MAAATALPAVNVTSPQGSRLLICAEQAIGAAGAVGALAVDEPGITVAKNAAAGTYDITFPTAPRGRLFATLVSPVPTVGGLVVSAIDTTLGTAQVVCCVGVTPTNPASGDKIHLMLVLDARVKS
jgi:hypothetical protein